MEIKLKEALDFATLKHSGQFRKYTGEEYIVHPKEVAAILTKYATHFSTDMICAAYLHDVIEDCGVTKEEIEKQFGSRVADMVEWLTDISKPTDGNRKVRKEIDRQHIAKAPPEVKTIKLADILSNTPSIIKHDSNFAKTYIPEKIKLMEVLKEGDPTLYKMCQEVLGIKE